MNEGNKQSIIILSDENLIAKKADDPYDTAFVSLVRGKKLTWRDLAKMSNNEIDKLIAEAGIDNPAFNDRIYTYRSAELSLLRD